MRGYFLALRAHGMVPATQPQRCRTESAARTPPMYFSKSRIENSKSVRAERLKGAKAISDVSGSGSWIDRQLLEANPRVEAMEHPSSDQLTSRRPHGSRGRSWAVALLGLMALGACADDAKPFRAPLLLTSGELARIAAPRGVLALGEVVGGRLDGGKLDAYLVSAPAGAQLEVTATAARSGGLRLAVALYGPRTQRGLFGSALAATRTAAMEVSASLRVLEEGTYLVLVAAPSAQEGDYQLRLQCTGTCAAPACAPSACLLDCPSALARDARGCEACACETNIAGPSCVEGTSCGAGRVCRSGVCVDGCACPDAFAPVCGQDGRTYASACEARCFGAAVANQGACVNEACGASNACAADERCELTAGQAARCVKIERCAACPTTFEPVCGADGQTYGNACLLDCAGVTARRSGVCVASSSGCTQSCTTDADCGARDVECASGRCQPRGCSPEASACGSDGVTYASACEVPFCRGVRAVASGSCCRCAGDFTPVCGRDGRTYSNRCEAGCAGARVATEGACPGACLPTSCGLTCAFGFRRDASGCEQCACQEGPRCAADADCPNPRQQCVSGTCRETCACPDTWAPVCGPDEITYRNACQAFCAGVLDRALEGGCPRRTLVERSCGSTCNRESGPVCGEDGNQYDSDCALCSAGVPSAGPTPCVPASCGCSTKVEPVCGADGVTYGQACLAACVGVEVASVGGCASTASRCAAFGACELRCPSGFEVDPRTGCRTCACRP